MRRARKAVGGVLNNTAYILGLWALGAAGMLAALALLALVANAGLI